MPRLRRPSIADLAVPETGQVFRVEGRITKKAIAAAFEGVLEDTAGKKVSAELRHQRTHAGSPFVYSFLCFRMKPLVPFLKQTAYRELRFGFALLIERRGHLMAFQQNASGLSSQLNGMTARVDRRRLKHLWADRAKYQGLDTERMTVAKQELRSANYEADDLEESFVPAAAARSITRSIRMKVNNRPAAVTPKTGRVRMSAGRAELVQLVAYTDAVIDSLESKAESAFLNAFPDPVDLADLPADVTPAGLLINLTDLEALLAHSQTAVEAKAGVGDFENLRPYLSEVLQLELEDDKKWDVVASNGLVIGRLKLLKHSFAFYPDHLRGFTLRNGAEESTLYDWLRANAAFSIAFSSPEYFYAEEDLYRHRGFAGEASQVKAFLSPSTALTGATSEKGGPYIPSATAFDAASIFGILESTIAQEPHLVCLDLGDEWADYIGVANGIVTFYHCKHGDPTLGASELQVAMAQALKNLSRVKFRKEEMTTRIDQVEQLATWSSTDISRIRKGSWGGLRTALEEAIANPLTRWRVALVLSAVSLAEYSQEAAKPNPAAYFIQQVWLLSALVSGCRERDAQAVIYCQP